VEVAPFSARDPSRIGTMPLFTSLRTSAATAELVRTSPGAARGRGSVAERHHSEALGQPRSLELAMPCTPVVPLGLCPAPLRSGMEVKEERPGRQLTPLRGSLVPVPSGSSTDVRCQELLEQQECTTAYSQHRDQRGVVGDGGAAGEPIRAFADYPPRSGFTQTPQAWLASLP
jgi:hypothetical protein